MHPDDEARELELWADDEKSRRDFEDSLETDDDERRCVKCDQPIADEHSDHLGLCAHCSRIEGFYIGDFE